MGSPGDEPVPAEVRRLPGRDLLLKVLYAVIVIAILICLVFIWFLGMQLRYEYQAANYVNKGQFLDAADRYLKAHDEAQWGKDRYLFLVGVQYMNADEHQRAMDFFVRLNNEFPASPWIVPAAPYIERVLARMNPDVIVETIKTTTRLGEARAHLKASYKRLTTALKANKAGVSNQLVIEYEAYKRYYESYKRQLVQAHKAVASGIHPEKLEGP